MIKMATERVVALGRATSHFPRRRKGRRPHVATLHRWAKHGVKSDDGIVVILETIRVGRTLCTSVEAIQRFCDAVSAGQRRPGQYEAGATASGVDAAQELRARALGL